MADDITLQSTTPSTPPDGTVFATEDIGSKHYQKIIIAFSDGTTVNGLLDTGQDTMANSMPVVIASNQSAVDVDFPSRTTSGTLTAASQSVVLDVGGYGSIGVQLSGTWSATVGFDANVNGTNWQDLEMIPTNYGVPATTATANGIWYVDCGGLNQVRVYCDAYTSGTVNVNLQSNVASGKLGNSMAGDVASGVSDSGNPIKIGGVARNFDGTPPGTAATEGQRVNFVNDLYGRQYVEKTHPNYWHVTANYSTAQTDTSIKAAPGAGLKLYITDVVISTDTAMDIQLEHGTTDIIPPMYFAARGGMTSNFETPLDCAANTALTITSSAAGNHSVLVSGFTAP